jgi:hypothetical protein
MALMLNLTLSKLFSSSLTMGQNKLERLCLACFSGYSNIGEARSLPACCIVLLLINDTAQHYI